jgi:hypothetical protein
MARWGRFIQLQGTLSEAEHDEMVEALIDSADEVRRHQEDRRARLLEILHETDAVDLVAQLGLTYLYVDPDTFKEWESDRSPAHVEYVSLQVLGMDLVARKDVDPMQQAHLAAKAIDLVRALFDDARMLMMTEAVAARRQRPDDIAAIEYRLKTRMESLGVRGSAYSEHLIRVLHGCFDPFDDECRRTMGFTASDALALTHGIPELISDRIKPLLQQAVSSRAEMFRQLKHERRHRGDPRRALPDAIFDLPPAEAKRRVSYLAFAWMFRDSRALATFTAAELGEHCAVDIDVASAFLDAMTCPPDLFVERFHAFPGGAHPLMAQPVIKLDEGYFVPSGSALLDAIRPRIEDLLNGTALWDRYTDARAKFVEEEATARIESALSGARSWAALPWRSATTESDLDGLVTADDVTIRLQCKAGRLTASARRGAPERMQHDIGDLIGAAADQHRALDDALATAGATDLGFTSEQAEALERPLQFEAIVCLDDVSVWATETHKLRHIGILPSDRNVPWVLSLTDLMAVTDILQGAHFAHYLVRRQRIERLGRVSAHDELDWVGYYTAEGLYLDDWFEGEDPPHRFQLLSYTEPIDAWYFTREGVRSIPAPKPAQPIPEHLKDFLERLERTRPQHWILAAIGLLDGDGTARATWNTAIAHARDRVQEVGWSNASQIFAGRYGLTLYVDLRIGWPAIRTEVAGYCSTKAEEQKQPNWIGIGEGAQGGLFVILVERSEQRRLVDVFLRPDATIRSGHSQDHCVSEVVPASLRHPTHSTKEDRRRASGSSFSE